MLRLRIPRISLGQSRRKISYFNRSEQGSSLIELALVLPIFILLLIGAVDFGRGWYVNLEVTAAAEAGALYGVQNVNDISGMKAAALLDATDIATLQASATYGNECSDGTSAMPLSNVNPTCNVNPVAYVEVDTTATYTPILKYPGLPSSFALSAKSRMRSSE